MDDPLAVAGNPRVLFVTDNGHGVGHLTRLMAVARRAKGRFTPVFLTLSEAHRVLPMFGLVGEYLPSARTRGLEKEEWEPTFVRRVEALAAGITPAVVVIDHVVPPASVAQLRETLSDVIWVWSRRGMWRRGRNLASIEMSHLFDFVVEPGDVASPFDTGRTATGEDRVLRIPPVLLIDEHEKLDRNEARLGLGLPPDGRAILINLSHSDPVVLTALVETVRDAVRQASGSELVHLFAPLHTLHVDRMAPITGVTMRAVYPLARFLRAFDGVVSSAGYNSLHEVVASGLAAVVVARETESLDDQARRARYLDLCGRAFYATGVDAPEFGAAVARMMAPGEVATAAAVTEELGPFDGSTAFADILAEAVGSARHEGHAAPDGGHDLITSLPSLRDGTLPEAEQPIVLVVTEADRAWLAEGRFDSLARASDLLLVESGVQDLGMVEPGSVETFIGEAGWRSLGLRSHADYLASRLSEISSRGLTNALIVRP